ncbi:MAG TPA: glutathione S-transferase [Burkholderiales bacterium]|nr:glutathione S-transferase [Burkholderiales bacterium]
MITIHHLGVSQSERIVWLAEELGLPYKLKWYDRMPNKVAPPEFLKLHPTAMAPVIEDGDRVLTESAVIAEYLCHRHAGGKFTVRPEQPNYYDYLYWMHWNNSAMGLRFTKSVLAAGATGPVADTMNEVVHRREDQMYNYLNQRLGEAPYLAGPEFTCADIMSVYRLTTGVLFGARAIDDLPNVVAYVKRIEARPAYRKAMSIAGPKAVAPRQ